MLICGIDEAGRGPVLGPLVICGFVIKEGDEEKLVKMGVKDSKLMTPAQRERVAKILVKEYKYKLIKIPSKEIDDAVSGEGTNLNWLEAEKAAELINELKPDSVILDCPSPNIKAYSSFISERLKDKKVALKCVHHADRDFVVVGAASIIAKVERDREIEEIKKKIGIDFGSGYPADPRTKEFLERYWSKYPEIFRHSWASFKKVAGLGKQQKLEGF